MNTSAPLRLDPARIQQLVDRTQSIQGWLSAPTAEFLYQLARFATPTDVLVELGSWRGLSTAWIAAGLIDRGRGTLIAVDTWAGTATEQQHAELLKGYGPDQLFHEFLGNMRHCGVAERVEARRATTREAALAWRQGVCIGVLHIDAGHEYADVRADFELWTPYVVDGGYIVFDDVPSWAGPSRVVSELSPWYRVVATPPNKWVVQKLPPQ